MKYVFGVWFVVAAVLGAMSVGAHAGHLPSSSPELFGYVFGSGFMWAWLLLPVVLGIGWISAQRHRCG